MSGYTEEYKLNYYQKVSPLNAKDNLWIVKDSVTENQYVMRKLPIYSREAYEILAAIHHPNIVEIMDVFSHEGCLYVIEEYLEWENLSQAIAERCSPGNSVFSIGIQLLDALAVLHEHKIIHRDIKPENILIDKLGNVKLIDFDIARVFSEDKERDTSAKGSGDYAPPEQFGFSQTDYRSDIYSLGVTLNEISTGTFPNIKVCSGRLGIFVRRCIEFDPGRRYRTARQALKHLKRLQRVPLYLCVAAVSLSVVLAVVILFPSGSQNAVMRLITGAESVFQEPEFSADADSFYQIPSSEEFYLDAPDWDRIISMGYLEEDYPYLLMSENKTYEFTADMGTKYFMTASAVKEDEHLELICELQDGSKADFLFEDVFSDTYHELGYSINTDFEKTSPEYEILFVDFTENEKTELLVTLAWRQQIDAENYRYHFTEYSTVWVVYLNEQNQLCCSEPLYFEGESPKLDSSTTLFSRDHNTWYYFKNEEWDCW